MGCSWVLEKVAVVPVVDMLGFGLDIAVAVVFEFEDLRLWRQVVAAVVSVG